jgi:tetratricopeptide (TPR) repeat protein
MNWRAYGVIFLALLVTGFLMEPVQRPAWEALREKEPALDLASLEGALGQGITVGLLGGFRAVLANFMWLRVNAHWEDYDLPGTQTMINFVTTVDPRPTFFWLNGARMIAYDMAVWRVREIDRDDNVPRAVKERLDDEQGMIAIRYLERGLNFHPDHPLLFIEIANIYQRKRLDVEQAAEYYRRASLTENTPTFAPRIYAELLRRLDRKEEAYEWLSNLYLKLDPENMTQRPEVVLERIRDLEDELEIPILERFQPPFQPVLPVFE